MRKICKVQFIATTKMEVNWSNLLFELRVLHFLSTRGKLISSNELTIRLIKSQNHLKNPILNNYVHNLI